MVGLVVGRPAPRWRIWLSRAIDTMLAAGVILFAAQYLPTGLPPAGAMSFYSQQQFENYFTMVAWAVLALTILTSMIYAPWRGTPGDLLARIKLTALDGGEPRAGQILLRYIGNVLAVLLICVPGPLLALIVMLTVGWMVHAPLTTAEAALVAAGVARPFRLGIHALSFVALGWALWYYVFSEFTLRRMRSTEAGRHDRISGTAYALRDET